MFENRGPRGNFIAGWVRLAVAATIGFASIQTAVRAQEGPYLSDLPKQFPGAYANWKKVLPYAIDPKDWLTKFNGVVSPIRDVTIDGYRLKFGTVCVQHDCGGNIAGVLFAADQSRIVALVRLSSTGGPEAVMTVGGPNGREVRCIRRLLDDFQGTGC